MAKAKGRRRFNLRRVRLQSFLAVGALVSGDVIAGAITAAPVSSIRIMSLKAAWNIADKGASDDDAYQFGVAHSDYTAAEIEECLESQASMDLGDKIAQEQANRLVRVIGSMSGAAGAGGGIDFKEGAIVSTKLNWLLSPGDTLNAWVRNGSGATYVTGALLLPVGDLWVKDSV